eukprot:TRINITY_DN30810_c0_g1_i1.p1 TRINITY_DN30810_c0_g1~~TRINITY_DN30810_c0_g1_i1.p1  ORF type:complete len:581 (+),score=70.62 TRINITY_DN30810_c0_g1_i1:37-1779(+)
MWGLVTYGLFLVTLVRGSIQPGELYPSELVGTERDLSDRCRLKIKQDYKIAKGNANMPMNAYELFSACDKNKKWERPEGESGLTIFLMIHSCTGLRDILSSLYHNDIFVLVHLDLSVGSDVSACVQHTLRYHINTQTYLLPEPFDTEWGSWEMIAAEYSAMNFSMSQLPDIWPRLWSHFLVMSGSDFPLVPASDLVKFFDQIPGKSYFYSNKMDDQTAAISLSQMTSVCDGKLYHLGWKSAAPPRSYFTFSNTWKFWSRRFVNYVLSSDCEELFAPLIEILSLTPSVDEVFWSTLHANSPHCGEIASIHPRDFYYFLWPVDDPGRHCHPSIFNSPLKWYCPKRPYTWGVKDLPRMIAVPSLFIRKVSSSKVRETILLWEGSRPPPRNFSSLQVTSGVVNGEEIEFSFRALDPPDGDESISQLLWWGWVPVGFLNDPHTGVSTPPASKLFDLTDCTGLITSQSGHIVSERDPAFGNAFTHCRIRPKLFPSLCLSSKSSEATSGMSLGFVPCSLYQEPQIFSFHGDHIRSAAKASQVRKDPLCLLPGSGNGLESTTLQPCSTVKAQSITHLTAVTEEEKDEL